MAALAERGRELAEARAQQTATSEVLRLISRSSADTQPVFESIVLTAVRLLHCDLAGLFACDESVYSPVAGADPHGLITLYGPSSVAIDPAATFPSRAIAAKEILHIPDWSRIELPEVERRVREESGLNSTLYLPLLREGGCIGLMVFGSKQADNFGAREIALAESFRDHALVAIENTRLFNQAESRRRDLEESLQQQTAAADVLKVISRSVFDLQTVLDTLVESAYRLCGARMGLLYLRGEEDAFECKAIAGAGVAEAALIFKGRPIRAGRGTAAERVILTGDVQSVEDFSADPDFDPRIGALIRAAAATASPIADFRSALAVPMKRDDAVVGVIAITRSQTGPFPRRQIELLQTFADQAVIAIENARLFGEVQAKTRDLSEALLYQTGSSEILKVIAASPTDVAPVLQTIVDSACEVCEAYDAAVVLKDGDDLRFSAHRGPIPIGVEKWPINRGWVGGRAFVDGKPFHVRDLTLESEEFPDGRELARRMGHRTILAVPLLREGESIGAIIVRRNEVHPFTDKQIALLQTFADQAVIAIGNVRLFDEVQARTRDLSEALQQQTATAEVLKVISRSAFGLKTVLQTLVDSAVRLCATDGVIYLRRGDEFRAEAAFGADVAGRDARNRSPRRPGRGSVTGRVALSGRVEQIPDNLADPDFDVPPGQRMAMRSLLGVPLLRGGEVEGVFVLGRPEPGPFSDRAVELVRTFADQAVIAIENVRLFDEVQSRTRDLSEALQQQTATADVLKVISRSAFDLQAVFDTLIASAVELCGANRGAIFLRDGDVFPLRAASASSPEYFEYWRAHPAKAGRGSATARVILSGKIESIPDVLEDVEMEMPANTLIQIRATLGVPLLRDNHVEGVLVLTRQQPGVFTPRQVDLVQTFADQAVIAIENVRLFDEVQARTRDLSEALQQQTATADVLKAISRSAFDLQTVLDTLVRSAVALCDASGGMIYIKSGDAFYGKSFADYNEWIERHLKATPQRPGRGSIGARVLLTGEVQNIADLRDDSEYDQRLLAAAEHRAVLGVPLLRDRAIVGAIVLGRKRPEAFTPRQIELVQTFADQAVIAIENVRLFDEVQARTRDLSEALQQQTATADVLKVISRSAFDLQAVFDTLTASAVELCGAFSGSICVRDGDLYRYRGNAGAGVSPAMSRYLAEHPATTGRGSIVGRVLLSGRVEAIPNVLEDADYVVPLGAHGQASRSLLGVPLLAKDRIEGALVLTREAPGHFTERQIEIVQTFADQAVIAIENARLFDEVQARTKELAASLDDLRKAQDRLVQSEKLASLGQLTAGIAHEIKNPLNFINNFAALSRELLDELREIVDKAPLEATRRDEAGDLLGMLASNLDKVVSHGKRADSIVKNMLLHSREGSGERASVSVNAMVEEALNLAYHGARAEKPGFNATIVRSLDPAAGAANIYAQEITRVLLNLISNGFYATAKRGLGAPGGAYEPTITASTRDLGDHVEIAIRDNGTGVPDEVKAKMFNPFFTTKPAGEGTGLGLSLSHDIVVKQHGGAIEVATEPGAFTQFTIVLPRNGAAS